MRKPGVAICWMGGSFRTALRGWGCRGTWGCSGVGGSGASKAVRCMRRDDSGRVVPTATAAAVMQLITQRWFVWCLCAAAWLGRIARAACGLGPVVLVFLLAAYLGYVFDAIRFVAAAQGNGHLSPGGSPCSASGGGWDPSATVAGTVPSQSAPSSQASVALSADAETLSQCSLADGGDESDDGVVTFTGRVVHMADGSDEEDEGAVSWRVVPKPAATSSPRALPAVAASLPQRSLADRTDGEDAASSPFAGPGGSESAATQGRCGPAAPPCPEATQPPALMGELASRTDTAQLTVGLQETGKRKYTRRSVEERAQAETVKQAKQAERARKHAEKVQRAVEEAVKNFCNQAVKEAVKKAKEAKQAKRVAGEEAGKKAKQAKHAKTEAGKEAGKKAKEAKQAKKQRAVEQAVDNFCKEAVPPCTCQAFPICAHWLLCQLPHQ